MSRHPSVHSPAVRRSCAASFLSPQHFWKSPAEQHKLQQKPLHTKRSEITCGNCSVARFPLALRWFSWCFCTGQQFSHAFISRAPGWVQRRCHKDSGYQSRLTPLVILWSFAINIALLQHYKKPAQRASKQTDIWSLIIFLSCFGAGGTHIALVML